MVDVLKNGHDPVKQAEINAAFSSYLTDSFSDLVTDETVDVKGSEFIFTNDDDHQSKFIIFVTEITEKYVQQFSEVIQSLGPQLKSESFNLLQTSEIAGSLGRIGSIVNDYIAALKILENVDWLALISDQRSSVLASLIADMTGKMGEFIQNPSELLSFLPSQLSIDSMDSFITELVAAIKRTKS